MPDPQTLAQLVRAKYPGAYDDLTDQQLETAVKTKYPGAYDDLPTTPTQAASTPATSAPSGQGTFRDRVDQKAASGDPTAQSIQRMLMDVDKQRQNERNSLPMIGGMIAAGLTGGASIPVSMAATAAGGAVGQLAKDSQWDMPMQQRIINAGKSALAQGALEGAAGVIGKAAPWVEQGAKNLWARAAKIPETVAKGTRVMREGGTLREAKDAIAETVLSQRAGTIREGNLSSMKTHLQEIDDLLSNAIANAKGFVPRSDIERALMDKSDEIGIGSIAQETKQNALSKAFDLISKKPARMTVQEAQRTKQQIYQSLQRSYPADAAESAAQMADKVTGRALREGIETNVPEAAGLNRMLGDQISATKAMDKALSRVSNRDVFSLATLLAGSSNQPLARAMAVFSYPGASSFTAQRLYNAAKFLPASARTAANIVRAAQIASRSGDQ